MRAKNLGCFCWSDGLGGRVQLIHDDVAEHFDNGFRAVDARIVVLPSVCSSASKVCCNIGASRQCAATSLMPGYQSRLIWLSPMGRSASFDCSLPEINLGSSVSQHGKVCVTNYPPNAILAFGGATTASKSARAFLSGTTIGIPASFDLESSVWPVEPSPMASISDCLSETIALNTSSSIFDQLEQLLRASQRLLAR